MAAHSSYEMTASPASSVINYPPHRQEFDLLTLLDTLWLSRKKIALITLACALLGLGASFVLPQRWTSRAVVTEPSISQLVALNRSIDSMQMFDVDIGRLDITTTHTPEGGENPLSVVRLNPKALFARFLMKFNSQSLLERYLASTPWFASALKRDKANPDEAQQLVARVAENMKAATNTDPKKPGEPYNSWTLSYTSSQPRNALTLLKGYTLYVNQQLRNELLAEMRSVIKLNLEQGKKQLALDKARLATAHRIDVEKLQNALQIAGAAGINKPVESYVPTTAADPDYAIKLGADVLAQKLKIEAARGDVSQQDADIQNRTLALEQLAKLNVSVGHDPLVNYLLEPSLPVKKDGPGRALVMLLATLLGFLLACGIVLAGHAFDVRRLASSC